MRQGITTRYLPTTSCKGARIKAIARKASSLGKEMSLTVSMAYEGPDLDHATAAHALATKLGWDGLWIAGGKPEEDGNMYVNLGRGVGGEALVNSLRPGDFFIVEGEA